LLLVLRQKESEYAMPKAPTKYFSVRYHFWIGPFMPRIDVRLQIKLAYQIFLEKISHQQPHHVIVNVRKGFIAAFSGKFCFRAVKTFFPSQKFTERFKNLRFPIENAV